MEKMMLSCKFHSCTAALLPPTQFTQFPALFSESKQPQTICRRRFKGIQETPGNLLKVYGVRRRRRADMERETYVLMEPGKNEEFVTEEELCQRLKDWLENWPAKTLPPDLARFDTTEDAVQFLLKSVCELEIDGDVGSLQWYQVRLDD